MRELAAVYCGFSVPSQVTEEVAKPRELKPKERFPWAADRLYLPRVWCFWSGGAVEQQKRLPVANKPFCRCSAFAEASQKSTPYQGLLKGTFWSQTGLSDIVIRPSYWHALRWPKLPSLYSLPPSLAPAREMFAVCWVTGQKGQKRIYCEAWWQPSHLTGDLPHKLGRPVNRTGTGSIYSVLCVEDKGTQCGSLSLPSIFSCC